VIGYGQIGWQGVEPEKDLAVLKVRNIRNLPRPIDVGTSNDSAKVFWQLEIHLVWMTH
jgi:hypothetical protein